MWLKSCNVLSESVSVDQKGCDGKLKGLQKLSGLPGRQRVSAGD